MPDAFRYMRYLTLASLIILFGCASAAAQGVERERVSIGAAAGIADPIHGDFQFKAPAWQVDVRLNTGRFLASTVFFEQWRKRDEDVRTNIPILGPTGPIGQIDRLVSENTYRTRIVGWSLLAKSNGRAAVNGGGGVSYMFYSRESSSTAEGCMPATLCGTTSSGFDNGAFSAHLQTGVDVRVLPRLAVMGQFRLTVPIDDPGSGHGAFTAGARVVF